MESSERQPEGGALAGVRVVEFSSGMAGPWIGRLMAYCGAEVIKIESHQRPSVVRLYVSPRAPELGIQPTLSPWFTDWDAGKRFVALDLARPEGAALARRIVSVSDVVVENYSSGVMEKLGLGYEELAPIRPDLVYFSSSGYGDTGPCRRYVSWGSNIEAMSGLATLSGFPERPCTVTQFAYPDALSALHGLFAVLCALDYRSRTGEGQRITLSQLEATVGVLGPLLMQQLALGEEPPRLGNASLHAAPQGCYPCRGEDRWCAITVEDDAAWERLCDVIQRSEWRGDPRFSSLTARHEHRAEADAAISEWTRDRDAYEVMHTLQRAGIAAGVAQTAEDELRHDRHLAARGFFEEIEHLTKSRVLATGIPLGLTATPGRTWRAGAAMGQDNDYVFGKLLGMDQEQIRSAILAGAIEPLATDRRTGP